MNIIVVGAGVVGGAIAHELSSRGARVQVVDPRGVGFGATRASAGMLAPHIEGHLAPLGALGVRSLSLYDDFIPRVRRDSGLPVEYERSGTLQVARDAAELAHLCGTARALASRGVEHQLLDATEARRVEGGLGPGVAGALSIPGHGYVAAGQLARALTTAAERRGATLSSGRVESIEGGDSPGVSTGTGRFQGDAVVVAAGAWSGGLAGAEAAHVVKPIRGQLLQLRAAARPASRIVWGTGCYAVPWRDGTVLVGATSEDVGFDERATADGVRQLLEASAELLPALARATFDEVRVGLRPMTPDELPAIGPSSTMRRVFYATGHYRNGVLLAPLTAALVADLVLDGRADAALADMRPGRLGL